jgi:hypothetical protein
MLNPIQKEFHAEKNIAAKENNSYNPYSFRARTPIGAKAPVLYSRARSLGNLIR